MSFIAVCIYCIVMISIKWSKTAKRNALASMDVIVAQLLHYHMPLLYFVCNHLIIIRCVAKLVLYGWVIIRDISSFGSSEGENKTLRVCSFCSKNCIEQQPLVQYHIYMYHIWPMTKIYIKCHSLGKQTPTLAVH